SRRLPAALSETEASAALAASAPAEIAPESASQPRRRAFGTSAKTEETAARRRRAASKDVITWQRLGLLAVCIGIAGGSAMALQSLVGREEAEVAPDVMGNAAIASVAPSAPMPFVAAPAAPPPAQVAALEAAPVRPVLRNADPVVDASEPDPMDPVAEATASAFAASEAIGSPIIAPAPLPLPRQPPLPTPAPKHAAVTEAPAAAADKEEADPDEADDQAASGGEPTGSATIRSSVTMRAAPKNGAAPVLNLQAGQKVELVACKGWCEIVAEGKRGFIYKRFVDAGAPKQVDAATQ
ncbi:MAG TPA: SH3 domain-containing protein, partial [Ancylobacter sp.]